jgi:hypothetical protein
MKHIFNYFLTLALSIFVYQSSAQISITQSVIASTGGFISTSNYSISSTAGEAMVSTKTTSSIALTQGFHQPLSSSSTSTPIEKVSIDEFSMVVYPNPTSDHISIEITTDANIDVSIEIIDVLGKTCGEIIRLNQLKDQSVYQYNLSAFAPGLYYLKVTSTNEMYNKVIRIQKII